jgi:hypothetical protein
MLSTCQLGDTQCACQITFWICFHCIYKPHHTASKFSCVLCILFSLYTWCVLCIGSPVYFLDVNITVFSYSHTYWTASCQAVVVLCVALLFRCSCVGGYATCWTVTLVFSGILIGGLVILALVSVLIILFQCIDKHSLLLKQLYELLGIKRGKVVKPM